MIAVRNLTMRLNAGGHSVTILDDVTVEVPEKQMVAITGPSGSGKSTLLGLIAGLDKPTAGSIRLDGGEITALPENQMARYGRQVIDLILSLHRDHGSTLVLVTHDPALATYAERIITLRDGRIASDVPATAGPRGAASGPRSPGEQP